jgi:hypothetical protein
MVEGRYIIKSQVIFNFFGLLLSCNNPLLIVMVCCCDGVEGELKTYATRTLYLLEFKVKLRTRNGGIFMFHVDNV